MSKFCNIHFCLECSLAHYMHIHRLSSDFGTQLRTESYVYTTFHARIKGGLRSKPPVVGLIQNLLAFYSKLMADTWHIHRDLTRNF